MMNIFKKNFVVFFALAAVVLSQLVLRANLTQAATVKKPVLINGCLVEYFILDDKEVRVTGPLDRSKNYTVRLSVDIMKSKPACFTSTVFATGYLVTEDATDADKKEHPNNVKNGKVTAKYADACFQGSEFQYGDKVTKYADRVVSGNNSDKQVWRYFWIGSEPATCLPPGTRNVFDYASNAVYVQAQWAGDPPKDTPDTGVTATFDSKGLDQQIGSFFNPLESDTLPQLIASILRILFILVGMVAVIIIIISGFRMVIANGNEQALTNAKKGITWAIVGLIVALMAFSIVAIIQSLIQG